MELTQEYLRECLDYDTETGVFVWKVRPASHFPTHKGLAVFNSKYAGKPAGGRSWNGYARLSIDGRLWMAHRVAWLYVHGKLPSECIDHVNGNRADNRVVNLREATPAENSQNIAMRSTGEVPLLGVSHNRLSSVKPFKALIGINGTTKYIGSYATAEEAHRAYLAAKEKLHAFSPQPRTDGCQQLQGDPIC